jgi:uncharacterized protein YcbX
LNDNTPTAFEVDGAIARLFVYPVKSCAGVELQESVLTESGLDLDRAWMVVDANGVFVSQRALPRMALIRPQLKFSEVVLRAPGMLALHLQIDRVEEATQVKVWDDVVNAFDMGDLAAQWFSDFLNDSSDPSTNTGRQEYRLVRFDPDFRRLSKMTWTQGVEAPNQFADGFPALVISSASLDGLNRRLIAQGHEAVTMERFRPNIVLSGLDEHDEDRMDGMTISTDAGEAHLRSVKPCPRCPIPNIDPLTARVSPAVGDTLQTYRQDARVGGAVTFGMNVIVIDGVDLQLKVGQRVGGNYQF